MRLPPALMERVGCPQFAQKGLRAFQSRRARAWAYIAAIVECVSARTCQLLGQDYTTILSRKTQYHIPTSLQKLQLFIVRHLLDQLLALLLDTPLRRDIDSKHRRALIHLFPHKALALLFLVDPLIQPQENQLRSRHSTVILLGNLLFRLFEGIGPCQRLDDG